MCQAAAYRELHLPGDPRAASLARSFLRQARCPTHATRFLDSAVLLVSEVVTNALLHGCPPIVVSVECLGGAMAVRVSDGATRRPLRRAAGSTAESGRGIHLLDELSESWGVQPEGTGKAVWFRMSPA